MQNDIEEVMLFAAGYGSRMLNATLDTPKPLLNLLDKPILEYILDNIANSLIKIKKVVINVFYLKEKIINYLNLIRFKYKFKIIISNEIEKLEVGGGLKYALKYFTSNEIFTLNADSFIFGIDILSLLNSNWNSNLMDCLMFCTDPDNIVGQTAYDFAIEGKLLLSQDSQSALKSSAQGSQQLLQQESQSMLKSSAQGSQQLLQQESQSMLKSSAQGSQQLSQQESQFRSLSHIKDQTGLIKRENANLTYTGAQIIKLDLIKYYANKTQAFSIIEVLFNTNNNRQKVFGMQTNKFHKYLHANTQEQLMNVAQYLKNVTKNNLN